MRCAIRETERASEREREKKKASPLSLRASEQAYECIEKPTYTPSRNTTFGLLCIHLIMTGREREKYQTDGIFVDDAVDGTVMSSWRTNYYMFTFFSRLSLCLRCSLIIIRWLFRGHHVSPTFWLIIMFLLLCIFISRTSEKKNFDNSND